MRGPAGITGLHTFVQLFDPVVHRAWLSLGPPALHPRERSSRLLRPGRGLASRFLPSKACPWRTRVGGARIVEHRSKVSAGRAIEEARERYGSGVRSVRLGLGVGESLLNDGRRRRRAASSGTGDGRSDDLWHVHEVRPAGADNAASRKKEATCSSSSSAPWS